MRLAIKNELSIYAVERVQQRGVSTTIIIQTDRCPVDFGQHLQRIIPVAYRVLFARGTYRVIIAANVSIV